MGASELLFHTLQRCRNGTWLRRFGADICIAYTAKVFETSVLCIRCFWKNHDKSDPFGSFFLWFCLFSSGFFLKPKNLRCFFYQQKNWYFWRRNTERNNNKKMRKTLRVFLSSDRNLQRSLSPCRSGTSDFLEPWRISVNESDGVWIWTEKNRT